MKIIKDNYNGAKNNTTKIVSCEWCDSEFEVEENELTEGYLGILGCICPCCGRRTEEDCGEHFVNIKNLEFPTHYYHFGNGKIIENAEINRMVADCVKMLDEHREMDYTTTSIGDTKIFVERYEGDDLYEVTVCKNYWDTEIPLNYL